jgi:predicted Rossmann-fold nucleotide-binding protein
VLTWLQLGVHKKPCALLNSAQFYQPLLSFLDDVQEDRFMNSDHRHMLLCDNDPERLLDAMERFVAPNVSKWLDRVKS